MVALALLWSTLLMWERPSLFGGFAHPGECYCRLAELFLLGERVYRADEATSSIGECVDALLADFLLCKAEAGRLRLCGERPLAGLDAFAPLYEELTTRFEEHSAGDERFALLLLIGAYANASWPDALRMQECLWTPSRHVVRQMTLARHTPMVYNYSGLQ